MKKILIKLGLLDQPKGQIRKDVEIIPIQPNLELVVYWKVLRIGKGPTAILQAFGNEIIKFDCFGKNDGHYHLAPNIVERIFFEEETAFGQINKTAKELVNNSQTYLERQQEDHIRNIKIDQEKFSNAVEMAKKKMNFFLQTVPELKDLR
ncbi:hypothetical protein [Rhodohalobacter sulfatireducens]|uniref:Uncharacterized protein n=1 Tax=Rhodohalobacter sulfatireducens TaxID=2911366 RepID=A0ABS9KGT2_9BACT|nr:hypothetical protein [Rhodohalobacter sulfatireducens]MCG2590043.1 hypothetical protein [Rhodohalobacter sulfatireducens]